MAAKKNKNRNQKEKSQSKKSRVKRKTQAEKADKFDCYQRSVQNPENEVEFFEQAYREVNKRKRCF